MFAQIRYLIAVGKSCWGPSIGDIWQISQMKLIVIEKYRTGRFCNLCQECCCSKVEVNLQSLPHFHESFLELQFLPLAFFIPFYNFKIYILYYFSDRCLVTVSMQQKLWRYPSKGTFRHLFPDPVAQKFSEIMHVGNIWKTGENQTCRVICCDQKIQNVVTMLRLK